MKGRRQKAEGRGRKENALGAGPSSARLVVLVAALSMSGASAWAQQITTDPTRPAIGLVVVEAPEGTVSSQLQSVMISPTRQAAIINGVVVELGEKYGDAVLMRVAEDEVVLRSGTSRQVLKLHPGVDKKVQMAQAEPAAPAAAKSAPRKAKAKAKPKTAQKAKAKPKAKTQGAAKPAADSGAGAR